MITFPVTALLIAFISFAPGIFWLWYIYTKDKYAPEPIKLVVEVFFLGMIAAVLAMVIEIAAPKIFPIVGIWRKFGNHVHLTLYFIFVIGLIEEACKMLPVWLYAYRKTEFNEVIDGIIYSSAAALGFASLENLLYVYSHGSSVMIGRAVLSTFGHLLDSAFWGLGFGLAKFNPRYAKLLIFTGFVISIIVHGLYDVFAITSEILLLLILMVAMWKVLLVIIEKSNLISPFKHNWAKKMFACQDCNKLTRKSSKYCGICGKIIAESNNLKYFCGQCGSEAEKDKTYCSKCGYCLVEY